MENNNEFDVEKINEALERAQLDITITNLKIKQHEIKNKILKAKIWMFSMGALALLDIFYMTNYGINSLLISLGIGCVSFSAGTFLTETLYCKDMLQNTEKEMDELRGIDSTFLEEDNSVSLGVGKTLQKRYAKRRNIGE